MKFVVSSSPHLRSPETVRNIMFDVLTALFPVVLAGVAIFGYKAAITVLLTALSAMVTEAIVLRNKNIIGDGSAAVTGVLLGLTLPPALPWWMAVFGAVVAILIGKHVFGGLGNNLFNPALVGRSILVISWAGPMTNWLSPAIFDGVSAATPLAGGESKLFSMFTGHIAGSIGETSAVAILLGALWLFYKGLISWHIPTGFIAAAFIMGGLFRGYGPAGMPEGFFAAGLFHVLAGGLLLGAFFMATDMVTSPITRKGQLIYGVGCGVITMLIRLFGSFPEGVTFGILLMNGVTPLIDYLTIPRRFGEVRGI